MKTKIYPFLLALAALAVSASAAAQQYDFKVGQLYYKITNTTDKTAEVVRENASHPYYTNMPTGDITVPDKVTHETVEYTVTSIGDYTFSGCHSLNSIHIPNSVTKIGKWAFAYCFQLNSIDMSTSLTTIGDWAFQSCTSLTSIDMPNSLTTIGNWAFQSCRSLTSIDMPNSLTTIGDWAFYGCSGLKTVSIPASVHTIGNGVFDLCKGLYEIIVSEGNPNYVSIDGILFNKKKTTLFQYPIAKTGTQYVIPETVIKIGNSAFSYCENLKDITIPASATSIGTSVFFGCTGLTSITIPEKVTSIGSQVFRLCSNLKEIIVSEDNSKYTSKDGVLFDKAVANLIQYPAGKAGASYTIPASVTIIDDEAFIETLGLTTVTIPELVTTIYNHAFRDCKNLKEIHCQIADPASITKMGNNVFYDIPKGADENPCILYVPAGSKEKYGAAEQWKDFMPGIVEEATGLTTLSSQGISVTGGKGEIKIMVTTPVRLSSRRSLKGKLLQVFNLNGSLVNSCQIPAGHVGAFTLTPPSGGWGAGIYIVRIGNAAEKVVVW